jgi:hypothetical protein
VTIEAGGAVKRSSRRPDVRVDVQGLGSVALGGFTFAQLERAGRARKARARRLCADIFRGARTVVPRDLQPRSGGRS